MRRWVGGWCVVALALMCLAAPISCAASMRVSGQRNPGAQSRVSNVVVLIAQRGMWVGLTRDLAISLKGAFERRGVTCHAEIVPDDHFDGSALPEALKHADAVLSVVPIGLVTPRGRSRRQRGRVTRAVFDVTMTSTPGKQQLWRGQAEAAATSFNSMSVSPVGEGVVAKLESDGLLVSARRVGRVEMGVGTGPSL